MIYFHIKVSDFDVDKKREIKKWLTKSIAEEKKQVGQLDFIFCSDEYVLNINQEFLNHDYYTDIITFDYTTENKSKISGDIYISLDRINENAKKYNISFTDELHRVMIHGVLHLIGYRDKTHEEKITMRSKENQYLLERRF